MARQTQVGTRRSPLVALAVNMLIIVIFLILLSSAIKGLDILVAGFIPSAVAMIFIAFMMDTYFKV